MMKMKNKNLIVGMMIVLIVINVSFILAIEINNESYKQDPAFFAKDKNVYPDFIDWLIDVNNPDAVAALTKLTNELSPLELKTFFNKFSNEQLYKAVNIVEKQEEKVAVVGVLEPTKRNEFLIFSYNKIKDKKLEKTAEEKSITSLLQVAAKADPVHGLDFIKDMIEKTNPSLKGKIPNFNLDLTGVDVTTVGFKDGRLSIGDSKLVVEGKLPGDLTDISYKANRGFLYKGQNGNSLSQIKGWIEEGAQTADKKGNKWDVYDYDTNEGNKKKAIVDFRTDKDTQIMFGKPADDPSGYKYQSGIYIMGPKNGIAATVDVGDAQLQVPSDREWAYMNPLKASLDNTGAYKIYGKVAFTGYSVTTDDFVVIDTESADNRYVSKSGEKIMVVRSQTSATGITRNTVSGNIEGVGSITADEGVTFHYGKYDDQDSFGIITQDGLTYRVTKDGQFTPRVGSDTESAPAEGENPDVQQTTDPMTDPCVGAQATACSTACGVGSESGCFQDSDGVWYPGKYAARAVVTAGGVVVRGVARVGGAVANVGGTVLRGTAQVAGGAVRVAARGAGFAARGAAGAGRVAVRSAAGAGRVVVGLGRLFGR